MTQLVVAQRGLQFVSNFNECHARDYTSRGQNLDEFGCNLKSSNIPTCPIYQRTRSLAAQACRFCLGRRGEKTLFAGCPWILAKPRAKSSTKGRLTISARRD